jgi:ABC-type sugar transport system permease subunit
MIQSRKNLFCYLMVAPALILVVLLGILPMVQSLRMAFLEYNLLTVRRVGTPFVGLDNFRTLFSEPLFIQILVQTISFVVVVVGFVILLGLMASQVLNQEFFGRSALRTLFLLPWFIPPVIAAGVWKWLLNTNLSPINSVLRDTGLIQSNIGFLTDTNTVGPFSLPMLVVSLVRTWNGLPFVTVMLLAGLQSIPSEVYEAAKIDGASAFKRFTHITLPLLRPIIVVVATLLSISGIGYFEVNYVMTGGGPRDLTNILGVYAYDQAFTFYRFDYAATASSVILILTSVIAFFYIRYMLKAD